jgi:hypothetical protein
MATVKPSVDENEGATPLPPNSSLPIDNDPQEWTAHFASQDEEQRRLFERKFLRKIDTRLMPTLIVMYLLNFLDRSNLAQARQG